MIRSKKQKKSLRAGRQKRDALAVAHTRTHVPRPLFASELDVWIPFWRASGSSGSSTFYGVATKLNTLADANVTYIGLANFNAIYKRYRVIRARFKATTTSKHTTLNLVATTLVTNSATAVASYAIVMANGINPGGKMNMLSLATGGSDKCDHDYNIEIAAFEGTREVETSSDFAAATNAVADPAQLLYVQTGVSEVFGATTTLSHSVLLKGQLLVRYFDPVQQ